MLGFLNYFSEVCERFERYESLKMLKKKKWRGGREKRGRPKGEEEENSRVILHVMTHIYMSLKTNQMKPSRE